jgi:predicted transcriptional regulator
MLCKNPVPIEVTSLSSAKEELTRLVQEQPEDSTIEEIVRELAFRLMVERGLADSDAGRAIPNDEMARRIRAWPH